MKATIARPLASPRRSERTVKFVREKQTPQQLSYNPSPEDLTLIETVKKNFEIIVQKSEKVINENVTVKGIQDNYKRILSQTQNTFSVFFNSANKYFQQHQTMRLTAVTNQVISSASCRIPVTNFSKDWIEFSSEIDTLADSHPPPHISEIELKFKSISSALDIITHSNKNRKYPSLSLSNCVENILFLNNRVSKNITQLFMQPLFPHFESDLLKSFIDEIVSYKKVLSDAFQNEFVQSGILICDLNRIKSNIFTDCNDIIGCLKSAFIFPDEMKEIQSVKDTLDKEISDVMSKLSFPFAVIKPLHPMQPVKDQNETDAKEFLQEEEKKEEDPNYLLFHDMLYKIRTILELKDGGDGEEEIDNICSNVKELVIKNNKQEQTISCLSSSLEKEKREKEEEIVLFKSKVSMLENTCTELQNKILKIEAQSKVLESKRDEFSMNVTEKQNEIERLTALGNPTFIRKSVRNIIDKYSSIANYREKEEPKNDEELVDALSNLLLFVVNRKCQVCEIRNNEMLELDKKIEEITGEKTNKSRLEELETIENNILKMKEDLKTLKEEEEEIKQRLYDETVAHCQTNRMTEQRIRALTIEGVFEQISSRFTTLKRYSVSADEMAKSMYQQSHERLFSVVRLFQEITNEEEAIPEFGTSYEEKDKWIANIVTVISSQKEKIAKIINNHKEKEEQLQQKINELNKELGSFGKRMAEALGMDVSNKKEEDLVSLSFEEIKNIRAPFLKQIQELKDKITFLSTDLQSVYTRMLALYSTKKQENMMEDMHQIISRFMDEKNNFDKMRKKYDDTVSFLRTNIAKIDARLCTSCKGELMPTKETTDEILFERINDFIDHLTSPDYSSSFIEEEEIKKVLKPIEPFFSSMNPSSPLQYLALLIRKFLDDQKTLQSFSPSSALIDVLLRKISTSETEYVSFEQLEGLKLQNNRLKTQFERIAINSSLPELMSILIRLVTLFDISLTEMLKEQQFT